MNLWQIITGNSTLPVGAGANLWDHLNNQQGGGGGDTFIVEAMQRVDVELSRLAVEAATSGVQVSSVMAVIRAEAQIETQET